MMKQDSLTHSDSFSFSAIPQLIKKPGGLQDLAPWLKSRGYTHVALCTGGRSFENSGFGKELTDALAQQVIAYARYPVSGEPSPEVIDKIAADAAERGCDCAVGIGGGSVMDSAKAVSAMIPVAADNYPGVKEYLEGVGSLPAPAKRVGFAAVPTTAGTGSEATKNAVISKISTDGSGFKKSLRHDCYIPDLAILDGNLSVGCSAELTAGMGMDAITQLLESYVSTLANDFTDPLAERGLLLAGKAFPRACSEGSDRDARSDMALAAFFSGITLANADLGVVHGAAGLLGGIRPIPHGVACGTLLAESTKMIVDKLDNEASTGSEAALYALKKHSNAGYFLNSDNPALNVEKGVTLLLDLLFNWQNDLNIPQLGAFGFSGEELAQYAGMVNIRKTPVSLSTHDIEKILAARL